MNIVIFDTETTSLDKPFVYNIGYIIGNERGETLVKRDFVVEQIWHNLPLFNSAYYADKRPLYVERMRARRVVMDKFGYICQQMRRDFKLFEVAGAYAYNSKFDERVFEFNCDWFKCSNPFDTTPIFDIRGNVHNYLVTPEFLEWCEQREEFTETGNYSTTAETLTRYLRSEDDFAEEHTALADSEIEFEILLATLKAGAQLGVAYPIQRSIGREVERELHIKTAEQTDYFFKYRKIRINRDRTEITLK